MPAEWRTESQDPLIFAEFEWLAKRMMELDQRATGGPRGLRTSVADARSVLESEARLPTE